MTDLRKNMLFDFESAGSLVEPFDVYSIDNSCRRYVPSLKKPGHWIAWTFWSNRPHQDFMEGEGELMSSERFISILPSLTLDAPFKSEESIAGYLVGAAKVCWEFLMFKTNDIEPNFIVNSDDKRRAYPQMDQFAFAATQLETLVQTAWAMHMNLKNGDRGETIYRILPRIGQQFRVFDPEENTNLDTDERWQAQINCNWEPDDDGLARHEVAYGATRDECVVAAKHLCDQLEVEWLENLRKEGVEVS